MAYVLTTAVGKLSSQPTPGHQEGKEIGEVDLRIHPQHSRTTALSIVMVNIGGRNEEWQGEREKRRKGEEGRGSLNRTEGEGRREEKGKEGEEREIERQEEKEGREGGKERRVTGPGSF